MVRRILIFVIFCIAANMNAQYDPQFSQNMFNMLAVNPGYAGSSESINLLALNRNQWSGDYGIKTTVFSGDMPLNLLGMDSGIGVSIMNDEIGFFTNLSILLNYSAKFELKRGTIGLGLSLGLINQSLDGSKFDLPLDGGIYTGAGEDPVLTDAEVTGSSFDAGFGVFYQEKNFYAGASLSHLTKPKIDFNDGKFFTISRTFFLTCGYNHKIEDTSYEILPSIFYKTDGRSFQVDVNTLLRYKSRFWGGLSYRLQDAVVLLAGIELKNGVRFGYSYDITTSAIATAGSGGSHELMVGYNFDINFEKRTKRYKSVRYL